MKVITVTTAEEYMTIKAMGTYEADYKNGEVWSFNGKMYYLSHLNLSMKQLEIILSED